MDGDTLVSTTDLTGRITHCNEAFVIASGFDYDELLGQPHDIVRHPDVPSEAFKDLWSTVGRGRPWSCVVKNRRKNGDHYWVLANVTPVMQAGKPVAYMSVRLKPSQDQIRATELLYAQIMAQRKSARQTFELHAGNVRSVGWRDWLGKLHRLTLLQRAIFGMASVLGLTLLPLWLLNTSPTVTALSALASGSIGAAGFITWFRRTVTEPLARADRLAGCNLDGNITYDTTSPLGSLMRRLWLVNLNMRAIVSDVRAEVLGMKQATESMYSGSVELAERTNSQAEGVEKTSAAVEQISGAVKQTADTAHELATQSTEASALADRGGEAVDQVAQSMQRIQASSQRITEIIEVIEMLAFETNLLALNAAVEASHAGEHGRGFGVVAAEVRALAQRSTKAASQIRELIRDSSHEVEQGSLTVTSAAATIRKAVDSVQQVSVRLEEITLSTREEAQGVDQISHAMQVLDDVTQQNTALVRHQTSACEGLESRSSSLSDLGIVGCKSTAAGYFSPLSYPISRYWVRKRRKLSSLGPIFAFDDLSPTGC